MRGKQQAGAVAKGHGGIYFLAFLGALIYYLQVADGFWRVVLAFLKAVVWPVFLTHDVLKFIG